MALEKGKDIFPAIQRLFRPVSVAPGIEEGVPSAIVAMEFIVFAKTFEHRLGPVHLIGGRIGVVIAENAQQRTIQLLRKIDRRDWPLVVEIFRIVDNDITAPAIHGRVDAGERARREISVASAGAEADDSDFSRSIGLRAQIRHRAGDIAYDLGVSNSAGRPHARAKVVRTFRSFAKIQMRRYRRVTAMSQFTHNLSDPFVPPGKMMNDDDAGILSGGDRSGVISLALVAIVGAKFHRFSLQAAIVTHACTPSNEKRERCLPTGQMLLR